MLGGKNRLKMKTTTTPPAGELVMLLRFLFASFFPVLSFGSPFPVYYLVSMVACGAQVLPVPGGRFQLRVY